MRRLFAIEYFKMRNARYFWALVILFLLILIAIPVGARGILDYLISVSDGGPLQRIGLDPSQIPLFDFVDLWQNLTWTYTFFSLFLGFITIISIGNEFTYGTIKQNIIDGMSRQELFWSKVSMMVALSLGMSLAAFLIGLVMGLLYSPVTGAEFIFQHIEFIPAYGLHLLAFQLLCLWVALLIKRTGITLALLMFYVYVIESFASGLIRFKYDLEWVANLLPVRGIVNVVPNPFPKFILQETMTTVQIEGLGILLLYLFLFGYGSYRLLVKRDLG